MAKQEKQNNVPSLSLISAQQRNIAKHRGETQIKKLPSQVNVSKPKRETQIKKLHHHKAEHAPKKIHISKHIIHRLKKQALESKHMKKEKQNVGNETEPASRKVIPLSVSQKEGKIIDKYFLEIDGSKVLVEIKKDDLSTTYNLQIPSIDLATETLLNDMRNELVSVTTVSMKELTDPALFSMIKERFLKDARKLIREKLPTISEDVEKLLIGKLIHTMLGLGEIEFLINDPNLEEIVISCAKEPIRVYSRKYGWIETNIRMEKEEEILNYSNIIARRVGRQITVLNPLLDAHLVSGDRINAVLYPINTKGNTITIRKFARDPFTVIDFINNKTCSLEIASLIWLATEFEMNILISGGTASGKTSFLNACMPFIPPNQRIISIEDTRELMLPEFLYWTPLVTRSPNSEGKGEVTMLHLLINSLRMRPDRIILGEMRKKEEAMVLFEAMHTGHSVYATVHADSAPETISRLTNPPISVPPNLLKSVNLNVVMFRDRRKGIRRVLQVAEFETEGDQSRANILYRWLPEEDKLIEHGESRVLFEDISRNTGMSQKEIDNYLNEKSRILAWLAKNNIRDITSFGKVLDVYYKNKELLLKAINENNPALILKK